MSRNPDDIQFESITYVRMGKINRFVFHFRQGLRDKYPICCVFRFSLESALNDGKMLPLIGPGKVILGGDKRGSSITQTSDASFIPCGIFHHENVCNLAPIEDGED